MHLFMYMHMHMHMYRHMYVYMYMHTGPMLGEWKDVTRNLFYWRRITEIRAWVVQRWTLNRFGEIFMKVICWRTCKGRDQSSYAPSQWETSLHCNDVSHWLGAYLDWCLHRRIHNAIFKPNYQNFRRYYRQILWKSARLNQDVLCISIKWLNPDKITKRIFFTNDRYTSVSKFANLIKCIKKINRTKC